MENSNGLPSGAFFRPYMKGAYLAERLGISPSSFTRKCGAGMFPEETSRCNGFNKKEITELAKAYEGMIVEIKDRAEALRALVEQKPPA